MAGRTTGNGGLNWLSLENRPLAEGLPDDLRLWDPLTRAVYFLSSSAQTAPGSRASLPGSWSPRDRQAGRFSICIGVPGYSLRPQPWEDLRRSPRDRMAESRMGSSFLSSDSLTTGSTSLSDSDFDRCPSFGGADSW
jgi:hypothetical protein